ncbi:MAG: peroxiredoxin [Erysipelotrichaceae bacterium]|nr:peroxiredoxin [Erysipelotrichaceae bacterium]
MLKTGTIAPDFALNDSEGKTHKLSDYRGQKVILYFYPKDMTSGCTRQACTFGDLYPQFKELNTVIIGISRDSEASHRKFIEKYQLPFVLLSDPTVEVLTMYGAWQEKTMYGKKSMGTVRSTYLIDENGVIVTALEKVKAADNPAEMLGIIQKQN